MVMHATNPSNADLSANTVAMSDRGKKIECKLRNMANTCKQTKEAHRRITHHRLLTTAETAVVSLGLRSTAMLSVVRRIFIYEMVFTSKPSRGRELNVATE